VCVYVEGATGRRRGFRERERVCGCVCVCVCVCVGAREERRGRIKRFQRRFQRRPQTHPAAPKTDMYQCV